MSHWPAWAQVLVLVVIVLGLSVVSFFVVGRALAEKSWWKAQNPAIRGRLASLPGGLIGIGIALTLITALHLHVGRA